MRVERLLKRQDILGEGMMWLHSLGRIAWVDILGKRLMTAAADGTDLRSFDQPTEIGAVLPAQNGDLVLVRRNEVVRFDESSAITEHIWSAVELEPASNRFNDATIDPQGNLWIGSMDFDAETPTGNLWRITPDGTAELKESGFRCLNGPAFSPDGRILYLGDTMNGRVLAYDLDLAGGDLSGKRLFADVSAEKALCDGMAVDAEGNVWVCKITAGRIGCFDPTGKELLNIEMPVPMVTSCCFGGSKLTTLYVTTARIIMDDVDLAANPDSGSVYTVATQAQGLPPNLFGAGKLH